MPMTLKYKVLELIFRASTRYMKDMSRMEGLENIPPRGVGYIGAANHRSFADAAILPQTLVTARNEPIHMVSYSELFSKPVIGTILSWAEGIVLDRSSKEGIERFFEDAKRVILEKREGIGMHPEAHISKTGRLGRGRPGTARLAIETGCPVAPIALFGTDVVMSPVTRKVRYKRRALYVKVGRPVTFEEYRGPYEEGDAAARKEILAGCTTIIMNRIAEVAGQEYHFGERSLRKLEKYRSNGGR